MSVLVIAEHDTRVLKSSTLNTITAAQKISPTIDLLVAGSKIDSIVKETSSIEGLERILYADHPLLNQNLAEPLADLIAMLGKNYTHILAPASVFGKNCLPRAAALLDVAQLSDIIAIENSDTFIRPIYAGNALATVKSNDPIKAITIRTTAFPPAQKGTKIAKIENISPSFTTTTLSCFIERLEVPSERPELTAARVVVSGGRALGSKENFALVEQLADKLNAAIGASRAAVDAGFAPNDYQVGQTGKIVAPDLYIALGISGAIQHLAGMKDSKIIVAINKDEEAPIFQIADYGLVGDIFELVPQLIKILETEQSSQ
ncbi:MAG: FAD-binding protein [Candidatus Paracaedimonas acanthamoebae]|uniref:Electron transfer flavoprotein subunit alpha n=1 Tax=Candidatus Paracaedimonas acanthamoebae TaxID=244581 RepID=A0A8J7PXB3_9PROT|nr:FAD-binding protein [Candidatus Paracaedimonas acanthamoebae]